MLSTIEYQLRVPNPSALSLESFREAFSGGSLLASYRDKLQGRGGAGRDRITPETFARQIDEHIAVASRKCLAGTYRFTGYAEKLISKGKGKAPRIVSIPTLRDRLVLSQMHRLLKAGFADRVPQDLPNTVVRRAHEHLAGAESSARVWRLDLADFFGSVRHSDVVQALVTRGACPELISLVTGALRTPTVGRHQTAKGATAPIVGVPQGLPISNLLAEIAVQEFDNLFKDSAVAAERYVDDLLVIGALQDFQTLDLKNLKKRFGLSLNPDKSSRLDTPFLPSDSIPFLGYTISASRIAPHPKAVRGIIASLAAEFTSFHRGKRFGPHPIKEEQQRQAFVEDVNLRITGAVSEHRRYGWAAFYSETTDLSDFFAVDKVVRSLFERSTEFSGLPSGLKKISRALYEMKHRPDGNYVFNYNRFDLASKMAYLTMRGYVAPNELTTFGAVRIEEMFSRVQRRKLTQLERDVGLQS